MRRLVVSLHDVCPRTRRACVTILAELDRLGIHRRSLLVIPAEPGAELSASTAGWLRERVAAGDEVVHHGHYHRRQPSDPPLHGAAALLDALLARGAGECLGLTRDEMVQRLTTGRDCLQQHGLTAAGFCAPAWLYDPVSAAAVRELGFRYLTTHLRLRDLQTGRDHWAFGISNRPGPLTGDYAGRVVNEGFHLLHGPAPLVRIAIHPADVAFGRPFEHTLSLLRRLLAAGRQPVTYLDVVEGPPCAS